MVSVRFGVVRRLVVAAATAMVLIVLAAVALRLSATPAGAAPIPSATPGSAAIVVTGSGTIDVVPDIARLIVSVQTTAPTASQAESQNAAATDSVQSRIVRAGIPSSDISTIGVQVWPQYDYRSGPAVLNGFMATQMLQVTIHDLRRIGALIDAGVAGGATSVQSISYDVQDRTAATKQALVKAVNDARGKAEAMAGAAGIRLGSVMSMTDVEATPYPFPVVRAASPSAGVATQVSPPDVQLTVNVTVGWSIG